MNKLTALYQSQGFQNSADIHYSHSQHLSRFTEQAHVLWSPEDY
jgi:hypothetical protein